MSQSGEQTPLVQDRPAVRSASVVSKPRKTKGLTRAQGVHLLPLVLKWVRVAGILLAVWLVGYFRFSLTWILIAELVFVVYGVYRRNKTVAVTRSGSIVTIDEEGEPVLARVEELPTWVYFPDTERAEWLNKIIQQMWPYVGEFVENILRTSVESAINKNLPAKLTPFKFHGINIGNIPVRVGGVKVYAENVKRDEIILDIDVTLASDAEVTVSLRNITAGIKDIMVQGTVRVVMKPLVNQMPIIGGLSLFFLNQPNIDFDLTEFAHVLEMPLLSSVLRTIISDQIANFLVLPNKIPVQLIDNIAEAQIQYLLPQGVVYFTVIEAADLKKADIGILGKGKSDPYCKIVAGGREFVTDIKKNTLTPYWDKSFEVVVEECSGQVINFEVMDKDDPGPDDDLGTTYLNIDDLPQHGVIDQWLPLENVKTGQLHIRATWLHLSKDPGDLPKAKAMKKSSEIESTALLVIHIDSAKDLPSSKKYLKEPCPYVRLEVGNHVEKTQVKNASTNPKWEEVYHFLVTDPEVQELTVEVLDDGNHGKKLGDRKIRLNTILTSDDMVISRPHTLKNASRDCSIVMSLVLRILSTEKPAADDDNVEEEEEKEKADGAPKKHEPNSSGDRVTGTTESTNKEPAAVAETGDVVALTSASNPSNVSASRVLEKPDSSALRYRGLTVKSDGRFGQINLTLRHSGQRQRLVVVVHQCVGLIPCDSDNLADPYVRLYLLPDRTSATKRKTQTKKNDLSPVFDETFEWPLTKTEAGNRTIEVMVKNSVGPFSKKRVNMGVLHLNLSEVDDLSKAVMDWFELQDPDAMGKSSNPSLHRF